MRLSDAKGQDVEAMGQANRCFDAIRRMYLDESPRPPDIQPRSDFVLDVADCPDFPIHHWAGRLIDSALDHLHLLASVAGQRPELVDWKAQWHFKAPWTLMRSALESASQAIWFMSPFDRTERITRLLRLVHEDKQEEAKATRLTVRQRQRAQLKDAKDLLDGFEVSARQTKANWSTVTQATSLLTCINDSARKTKVAPPDVPELVWRVASGYAHGRTWARLNRREEVEVPGSDAKVYLESLDLTPVAALLTVATGTVQHAERYLLERCGLEPLQTTYFSIERLSESSEQTAGRLSARD